MQVFMICQAPEQIDLAELSLELARTGDAVRLDAMGVRVPGFR